MKVEPLYFGDKKADTLLQAIKETIYDRRQGMTYLTVLGILELIKHDLIEDLKDNL